MTDRIHHQARILRRTFFFVCLIISSGKVVGAQSTLVCAFNQPSLVTISGRQLIVQKRGLDGGLEASKPYIVKGVNWAPASRGSGIDDRQAQYAVWYQTDIALMKQMNVNTVRVFLDFGMSQSACDVLDELHRNGIMAVVMEIICLGETSK